MGTMLLISYTRSHAEIERGNNERYRFHGTAERVFILLFGYIAEWAIFAIQSYFNLPLNYQWFFPVFFVVYTILCIHTLVERMIWAEKWLNNKMPEKVAALLNEQKPISPPENISKEENQKPQ